MMTFALVACAPFEADDDRVGKYFGSFKPDQFTSPVYVEIAVSDGGLTHFWTGVESGPEVGSKPEQLSGGSRDLRFSTKRNGQDFDVYYDVDAVLLPGDQVIEGTLSYWTQNHGVDRVPGLMRQPFRARRRPQTPGYVQTTPGDFSCTGSYVNFIRTMPFPNRDGGMGARMPVPSCFSGQVSAMELLSGATTSYLIQTEGPALPSPFTAARSSAIFSACDGEELACDYVPAWDGGALPRSAGITARLTQFQSVVLVSDGTSADFWWLP